MSIELALNCVEAYMYMYGCSLHVTTGADLERVGGDRTHPLENLTYYIHIVKLQKIIVGIGPSNKIIRNLPSVKYLNNIERFDRF